jgi:hypothetical protein
MVSVNRYCVILIKTKVVTKWQLHEGSNKTRVDLRDFKKLNKMSVKSGSVTSKDVNKFRQSNDARITFGVLPEKSIMLINEAQVYGKRNRPQTPVNGIIAHDYGEAASREMQQRYQH